MNKRGWEVLYNLTFKTEGYRKNYDMMIEDEHIISEYSGSITETRITERKPPIIIGEYGFSIWNISLSKMFNIDLIRLVKAHRLENVYDELMKLINESYIYLNDYNKIIFVHNLIIRPDYRKMEITEEFFEFLYRDYYDKKTALIALVKPFQDNEIDYDFYFNHKTVPVRVKLGEYDSIPAVNYYSLKELIDKKDTEINEYKLFSVATRCGFERLGESHLFLFNPEKIINRMLNKRKENEKGDIWEVI